MPSLANVRVCGIYGTALTALLQVTPVPFGLRPAVLVRRGSVWVMEEPSDL